MRTHGFERLDRLRLWDVVTGKLVATAIEGKQWTRVQGVQFSQKGRLLRADDLKWEDEAASPVRLWHLDMGGSLRQIKVPTPSQEYIQAVSPDGRLLITRTAVKMGPDQPKGPLKVVLRIRELVSGNAIVSLEEPPGARCWTLSPDNRLLALGDEAGRLHLFETVSGEKVQQLVGHRGGIISLEFSPDGSLLVSGSEDTTALVWDLRHCFATKALGRAGRLGDQLWADLASTDAVRAFRAELTLRANPAKGTDLLKRRLRPVPPLDARAVQALIGELDSDTFEVRERAMDSLRQLGRRTVPLLTKALKTSRSLEVRRRLRQLLAESETPRNTPERLRHLRAVHCLRMLGTKEARCVLQDLAKGATEATLTQQAREALEGLK